MPTRTVRGTLTSEGVECQALRADTGELYTLVGGLAGFKAGDRVTVVGSEVEISFCMQGVTLSIISITGETGRNSATPGARGVATGGEAPFPPGSASSLREFGRGKYDCLRIGDFVVLSASGALPNWNDQADLVQMPWRIWPPQFGLYFVHQQISLPAARPFAIAEMFGFPRSPKSLTVNDADGQHNVAIRDLPAAHALASLEKEASDTVKTGYSPISLQAAFDAAVLQLPELGAHPDAFVSYSVKRTGLTRGGFPGLRLYFAQVEAAPGNRPGT